MAASGTQTGAATDTTDADRSRSKAGPAPGRTKREGMKPRLEGSTAAFLDAWDDEHAYAAAHRLEKAWQLPDGYCAVHFPDQHDRRRNRLSHTWHAMLLSGGNLDACRALLRGERVPTNKIDQRYLNLDRRRVA